LSCFLEDLESGAIRVALDGELDVATAPKPTGRCAAPRRAPR